MDSLRGSGGTFKELKMKYLVVIPFRDHTGSINTDSKIVDSESAYSAFKAVYENLHPTCTVRKCFEGQATVTRINSRNQLANSRSHFKQLS